MRKKRGVLITGQRDAIGEVKKIEGKDRGDDKVNSRSLTCQSPHIISLDSNYINRW